MSGKPRIVYNAPVVLTFTAICLAVTLLGLLTGDRSTELLFSVYRGSFLNPLTYLRCFTHVFGHVGLDHFISNAMIILLVGPMLEEKYGSVAILKTMVVTALVTAVVHCLFNPGMALCGASGVAFAFIVLSSFTSFAEGEIPLSFILVVVLFLGSEVYNGLFVVDSVSNLSHVVGGAVGAIAGRFLNKRPVAPKPKKPLARRSL